MKKFVVCMLMAAMTVFYPVAAQAATGVISNSTTYVPLRGAFEELGFEVEWDEETDWIHLNNGDIVIDIPTSCTVPIFIMFKDGARRQYDCSELININGSYYIPLRDIGENIGAAISWNGEEKLAHISYNGRDSYIHCVPYESIAAQKPQAKATYPNTSIPTLESCVSGCVRGDSHIQGKNFAYEYSYYGQFDQISNEILQKYEPELNKAGYSQNPELTSKYIDSLYIQGTMVSKRGTAFWGIGLVYTNPNGSEIYIAVNDNNRLLLEYVD